MKIEIHTPRGKAVFDDEDWTWTTPALRDAGGLERLLNRNFRAGYWPAAMNVTEAVRVLGGEVVTALPDPEPVDTDDEGNPLIH